MGRWYENDGPSNVLVTPDKNFNDNGSGFKNVGTLK